MLSFLFSAGAGLGLESAQKFSLTRPTILIQVPFFKGPQFPSHLFPLFQKTWINPALHQMRGSCAVPWWCQDWELIAPSYSHVSCKGIPDRSQGCQVCKERAVASRKSPFWSTQRSAGVEAATLVVAWPGTDAFSWS